MVYRLYVYRDYIYRVSYRVFFGDEILPIYVGLIS